MPPWPRPRSKWRSLTRNVKNCKSSLDTSCFLECTGLPFIFLSAHMREGCLRISYHFWRRLGRDPRESGSMIRFSGLKFEFIEIRNSTKSGSNNRLRAFFEIRIVRELAWPSPPHLCRRCKTHQQQQQLREGFCGKRVTLACVAGIVDGSSYRASRWCITVPTFTSSTKTKWRHHYSYFVNFLLDKRTE